MNSLYFLSFFICYTTATRYYNLQNKAPCNIVAFGNSFTDDGVDTDDRHGFFINSNGPVWPTFLARLFGCGEENIRNYAYAGALSGVDNFYFEGWSGNLWQIDQYLAQLKYRNPSYSYQLGSTIIALEASGGNDLLKAAAGQLEEGAFKDLQDAITKNNLKAIQQLIEAGHKNILFVELIEFALNAPVRNQDWFKGSVEKVEQSFFKVNKRLREAVDYMRSVYPYVRIAYVDTSNLWDNWVDEFPNANTTEPFTHHKKDTRWREWKDYLWYDEYHLLSSVHQEFAKAAYSAWNRQTLYKRL